MFFKQNSALKQRSVCRLMSQFSKKLIQYNQRLQQNNMISPYSKMLELLPKLSESSEFSQFREEVNKNFAGGFKISVDNFPKEQQLEYALMLCIINKKNQKIKSSNNKGEEQLIAPIQKNKANIIEKSNSNEQKFKSFMTMLKNTVNFVQKSSELFDQHANLIYHTVLTISNKQESNFIWMRLKVEYRRQDISKFAAEFEEKIQFIDYDKNKKHAMLNVIKDQNYINILKAKQRFFYLHFLDSSQQTQAADNKQKGQIKVIQQGTITTSRVSQIFLKKDQSFNYSMSSTKSFQSPNQPSQNENYFQRVSSKIFGNEKNQQTQNLLNQSSVRNSQVIQSSPLERKPTIEDSMILAIKVKCCKCEKNYSEVDCLYWNYLYYCHSCLIDINFDTSDIPAPRVSKFLRQRNIGNWDYDIQCPECESVTKIKNYNPANKYTRYRCMACNKVICVKHCGNIFSCYCYCPTCNVPTIYLQKLKINFCQNCRIRYCFKCRSRQKNNFCKCVCKYCLGEQSKTHECQPACHACNNKSSKLRICRCGLHICYGCFYAALEIYRQGEIFPCNQSEYS